MFGNDRSPPRATDRTARGSAQAGHSAHACSAVSTALLPQWWHFVVGFLLTTSYRYLPKQPWPVRNCVRWYVGGPCLRSPHSFSTDQMAAASSRVAPVIPSLIFSPSGVKAFQASARHWRTSQWCAKLSYKWGRRRDAAYVTVIEHFLTTLAANILSKYKVLLRTNYKLFIHALLYITYSIKLRKFS